MAEVSTRAKDPLLQTGYVAIKTIARPLAADLDFKRRFQREGPVGSPAQHTNIVTVFDFGEEDGLTYMAMELPRGPGPQGRPSARATSSSATSSPSWTRFCDGLAFAHARGRGPPRSQAGQHPPAAQRARSRSSTSASRGSARSDITKTGHRDGDAPLHVAGAGCAARRPTRAPTCSRWARSSTSCCLIIGRSRPTPCTGSSSDPRAGAGADPEVGARGARGARPAWSSGRSPRTPPALRRRGARWLERSPTRARRDLGRDGRGRGGGARATMFQAGDATVVDPAPAAAVRGATALSPRPRPGARRRRETCPGRSGRSHRRRRPGGHRPPSVRAARERFSSAARRRCCSPPRPAVPSGCAVVAAAPPSSTAGPGAGGVSRTSYVANQVELARADLASHDYQAAARRAEDVVSRWSRPTPRHEGSSMRPGRRSAPDRRGPWPGRAVRFAQGDVSGSVSGPRPG